MLSHVGDELDNKHIEPNTTETSLFSGDLGFSIALNPQG